MKLKTVPYVCILWSLDNKVGDLSQSPSKESKQLNWTVKPLNFFIEDVYVNNKDMSWYSIVCWGSLKPEGGFTLGLLAVQDNCFWTISPNTWDLWSFRPIKPHRMVTGYFLHFSRCSQRFNILESIPSFEGRFPNPVV